MSSCSQAWDEAGVPAYGSAPPAGYWIALEQPGAWGRDALRQSHLDPHLGERLATETESTGGRALLIRRPGRHAAIAAEEPRTVFVAGRDGAVPWLLQGVVTDPGRVLDLPLADLADTNPDAVVAEHPWLAARPEPVLLVCTNGARDTCCALRGRPVALTLAEEFGDQVWECTHTGGHRFAPTGLVLPIGQGLARLNAPLGAAVLRAADRGELAAASLGPVHDRGFATLPHAQAAAESLRRYASGDTAVPSAERSNPADVRRRRVLPDLPESCGKGPVPCWVWESADGVMGAG